MELSDELLAMADYVRKNVFEGIASKANREREETLVRWNEVTAAIRRNAPDYPILEWDDIVELKSQHFALFADGKALVNDKIHKVYKDDLYTVIDAWIEYGRDRAVSKAKLLLD